VDRPGTQTHRPDTGLKPVASQTVLIEQLAFEEQTAIHECDWVTARSRVVERAELQEARQRILAWHCSGRHT
jgi:hypothetical protein